MDSMDFPATLQAWSGLSGRGTSELVSRARNSAFKWGGDRWQVRAGWLPCLENANETGAIQLLAYTWFHLLSCRLTATMTSYTDCMLHSAISAIKKKPDKTEKEVEVSVCCTWLNSVLPLWCLFRADTCQDDNLLCMRDYEAHLWTTKWMFQEASPCSVAYNDCSKRCALFSQSFESGCFVVDAADYSICW